MPVTRERRAVVAIFPLLIVGGIVGLVIAATQGHDLGAPIGLIVGGVVFGGISWFLTRDADESG